MNMKKYLLTLIFALAGIALLPAQTFTGRVVDVSDGQAIAYADIIARQTANDKPITGALSTDDGVFTLTVQAATPFYIEVRFMGYRAQRIDDVSKADLGVVRLQVTQNELSEVVVKAQRPLIRQKIDRLVFDIDRSPTASIGDALDALRVTPGLNVQQTAVAIIGKQQVTVLINDRPVKLTGTDLMNYLRTIPAQNIKQIEVITTPPARYDAEGNSGLINIRLKAAESDTWSDQVRTTYRQGTYASYGLGNTFTYRQNRLSMMLSVDGNKGHRGESTETEIFYPGETWAGHIRSKEQTDNVSLHAGLDYNFTDKAQIGAFYSGVLSDYDNTDIYRTAFTDAALRPTGGILSDGTNDRRGRVHNANLHYLQKLGDNGRSFAIDLDYFSYRNDQDRRIHSTMRRDSLTASSDLRNIGLQDVTNVSGKIDFDHPITRGMLTYGAKWTRTATDNETRFYALFDGAEHLDPAHSNTFDYTEQIGAAYADVAHAFNARWRFKGGLRMEYTRTEGHSHESDRRDRNNYVKLFPTAYLTYAPGPDHVLSLNYSRRISRPGFWSLNPFRFYLNATTYQEGTPDLRPEISDNIELQYVFKGRLITKLYGILIADGYGSIPTLRVADRMQVYKSANFWNGHVVGLNETFLFNPAPWWNTVSTLAAYSMRGTLKPELHLDMNNLEGLRWQFFTQHTFFLNHAKTLIAELTYMYNSPEKNLISESRHSQFLHLGLKATFLQGRLQCAATLTDVLHTQQPYYDTYTNGVKQTYRNDYDSRRLTLSLSYLLGGSKVKVSRHQAGNTAEYDRAAQ